MLTGTSYLLRVCYPSLYFATVNMGKTAADKMSNTSHNSDDEHTSQAPEKRAMRACLGEPCLHFYNPHSWVYEHRFLRTSSTVTGFW